MPKLKKKSKSRVNEAGNYTKPGMRKRIFNRIKAGSKGGALVSGLPAKHSFWLPPTKKREADTRTDAQTQEVTAVAEGLDEPGMDDVWHSREQEEGQVQGGEVQGQEAILAQGRVSALSAGEKAATNKAKAKGQSNS